MKYVIVISIIFVILIVDNKRNMKSVVAMPSASTSIPVQLPDPDQEFERPEINNAPYHAMRFEF